MRPLPPTPTAHAARAALGPDQLALLATIARCGSFAAAASELGLSRQALYRRLDRLGIKRD